MEEFQKPKKAIIPGGYVSQKEKWSFCIGGLGQNMLYGVMSTLLMMFFTDKLLISAAWTTAIIVIARVWDAVNDIIMGTLVDKTKSKWGKFKPYLLAAAPGMLIMTILLFVNPQFGKYGMIIWATIVYILWGMIYTVSDIPFWGLTAAISPIAEERAKFLQSARVICSIGAVITMGACTPLISALGNSSRAYLICATVFAILGGGLFFLVGSNCKEKIAVPAQNHSFRDNLKILWSNKPLMLILAAGILSSGKTLAQVSATYIATYNFADTTVLGMRGISLFPVVGAGFGGGMFAGMLLMPALQKKWDLRQIFIYSSLMGFVSQLVMFFFGYSNIWVVTVGLLLAGLPFGCYNVLTYAMISDCVEYFDWRTGERTEGISFSLQTFITKLGAGIATGVTGLVLVLGHYVKPSADLSLAPTTNGGNGVIAYINEDFTATGEQIFTFYQSPTTLNWFYAMLTILPAISCLVSIIPILKYPLTGAKMREINAEMAERRRLAAESVTAVDTAVEITTEPDADIDSVVEE